ncbi:MFS transporter [Sulfolobus metallicus DSM 6482 = JCM 9184]|uniref:MFS transporter n=2 Tax=Sulfuracidifex metallicus TaxID=47303 RepID=A0A6A9QF88_SULME|nr:MFS transporter [Sulfuracidifex metallicus DSM 6482 = JCM 9184]
MLSSILGVIATRMFDTIIQPYLGIYLQFNISQISLIILISTIVGGILTMSLGILADFVSPYRILIFSLIATSIGILFLVLSNTFLLILIAVALAYIGFSARVPLMRTIIGRRLSKNELSVYFTIVPLTSVAAPLISVSIAQESYAIDLILILVIIIILLFIILNISSIVSNIRSDKIKDIRTYINLIKDKKTLTLPLLLAIIRFIFMTSFLYIPLYFTEIIKGSLLELGIMFSTEAVAISLAAFPSKLLSNKLGDISSLMITRVSAAITYSLLYFVNSPILFVLVNFIGTLFIAMDNIPEVNLISKMKTANLAMSLIDSLSTLLSICSPVIALYIWISVFPKAIFIISLFVIIPSIIMLNYKKLYRVD